MSRHIMLVVFALVLGTAKAHANVDVYPMQLNFLSTYVGDISFNETIHISNYYPHAIDLRVYNNCQFDFRVDDFDCRYPIPSGGRCNIRVQFWPATVGSKWCSIDIESLHGGFHRIDIRGEAVERPRSTPIPTPAPR